MNEAQSELRVVLIDDHELIRNALRGVLERAGMEVAGEASDGEEGIRLALQIKPDVVLMDLSMPRLSGIEATRRLATEAPGTRVLVVTGSAETHNVNDALAAGACGYLLKDADPEEMVGAVRAAARGETIEPKIRD